jgi:hypothetical protein
MADSNIAASQAPLSGKAAALDATWDCGSEGLLLCLWRIHHSSGGCHAACITSIGPRLKKIVRRFYVWLARFSVREHKHTAKSPRKPNQELLTVFSQAQTYIHLQPHTVRQQGCRHANQPAREPERVHLP